MKGQIKTKRLLLTLADKNDLPALEEIEKECGEYFKFDPPSAAENNRSLRECLATGDITPGVSQKNYKRENYRLYSIKKDDIIIGWLSFYLEYQKKDDVYLSVLYIKEACRSRGFGAEILDALARTLAAAKYTTIKTHCSLRNALSLRFWVKRGFCRVTEVVCDGNLYPDNFGGLGLAMDINPDNFHELNETRMGGHILI